jgi:hypothetical protein
MVILVTRKNKLSISLLTEVSVFPLQIAYEQQEIRTKKLSRKTSKVKRTKVKVPFEKEGKSSWREWLVGLDEESFSYPS